MDFQVIEEGKYKFIETKSKGPNLMLLHGLFGALSNFQSLINHFGKKYNVIVPILPIYELPIFQASVSGLVEYLNGFVKFKNLKGLNLVGNSLGGHIALLFALADIERIQSITLTGSSGLFESAMGSTFPKRGDYEYIKRKTEETFFNPKVATKELVDEVYDIVNDRAKAIRVIATAKSALRHNLSDKLQQISVPTLLIWGKNDNVTPPFVAEKFKELIPNARLFFLEDCAHAAMMEQPDEFNRILEEFLIKAT